MERIVTLSIVIPCYNARETVVETIQSALGQQDVSTEVIIVDDGSTDGSRETIAQAGLIELLRYVRQENQGVSVARNLGLDLARGEFICFLDSDDLLEPRFGCEMIELLRERQNRVGYCNYRYFNDDPGRGVVNIHYPTHQGNVKGQIISEHFIPTPGAVIVQRAALSDLRFDPRRSGAADWWFWIQLCTREMIAFNPNVLINIRVRPQSLGRQKAAMAADVAAVLADTDGLIAADPEISSADRARFLYRRASALLEVGHPRDAAACWIRAARLGLDARSHLNFLAKFVLGAIGARRVVERALWDRRTRQ